MALSCFTKCGECLLVNNSYNKVMLCNGKLHICKKLYQRMSGYRKSVYGVVIKRDASTNSFKSFDDMLKERRDEAERTIVVQIKAFSMMNKLIDVCSPYGAIKNIHHYRTSQNSHHGLIEFESPKSVREIIDNSGFKELAVPVRSHFMLLKNNIVAKSKYNQSKKYIFEIKKNNNILSDSEILNKLNNADSISQQIAKLYQILQLNDTEKRLRFLTAHQIEERFSGLFDRLKVFPFGSSVNGFGKRGSDLDLVMCLDESLFDKDTDTASYFMTKTYPDEKSRTKAIMQFVAEVMRELMIGIDNVRKILNARVPIIKYHQSITNLECDVSMTNMTAIHMSELLYLYGEYDTRIRPLIFAIRQWAYFISLTNPRAPGPWITNFSLTLLALYFFQTKEIIPTLDQLQLLAGKSDIRIADDYINCTFLRNINKFPKAPRNTQSLESLLLEFFQFYSTFNFNCAISIREGKAEVKQTTAAMWICNPLEITLNVSKNVTNSEVCRLQVACAYAAEVLQNNRDKNAKNFGLLSIFKEPTKKSMLYGINFRDIVKSEVETSNTEQGQNIQAPGL